MLQASLLAGMAFNSAFLGLAHAIASPLGGYFHVPHGLANAVMLPYVMEFNLPSAVRQYAEIGCALGLRAPGDTPRAVAAKTVAAVTQLARDINIPERLRDIGAKEKVLPMVAKDALKSIQLKFNARNASEREILALLQKAF
jgi:alcohol dehydrogenase class IV